MTKAASKLKTQVADVLEGVLIHQRQRWGALLRHAHGYEGWWKAECAAALENWCWRRGPTAYCVVPEARPRNFGLSLKRPIDLLVAPWDEEEKTLKLRGGPRAWIELKERGTRWGTNPVKAFGQANHGLLTDFEKLSSERWTEDDVALACQIVSHVGDREEFIEAKWREALKGYSSGPHKLLRKRPAIVGYPLPHIDDDDDRADPHESKPESRILWASMFIYEVQGRD